MQSFSKRSASRFKRMPTDSTGLMSKYFEFLNGNLFWVLAAKFPWIINRATKFTPCGKKTDHADLICYKSQSGTSDFSFTFPVK